MTITTEMLIDDWQPFETQEQRQCEGHWHVTSRPVRSAAYLGYYCPVCHRQHLADREEGRTDLARCLCGALILASARA